MQAYESAAKFGDILALLPLKGLRSSSSSTPISPTLEKPYAMLTPRLLISGRHATRQKRIYGAQDISRGVDQTSHHVSGILKGS